MSSRDAGSQDFLLQSQSSDDRELGDFRSPHDGSDFPPWLPKSPRQHALGLIEPFAVDESDLDDYPSTLCNTLLSTMRSCVFCRTRSKRFRGPLFHSRKPWLGGSFGRRPRALRYVFYLLVCFLSTVGVYHLLGNVLDALEASFPDDIDWILHHWGRAGEDTEGWSHWPTDATGDIHPVNCHSHNDYWRSVPLYAAISAGCTGAEADVWLVDEELYVGHRRYALTSNRTLQHLYINPLLDLLEHQNPPIEYHPDEDYPIHLLDGSSVNGVFDVDPSQTFVLLIDFKSSGASIWWELEHQLAPLREKGYLTHFNGTAIVERPVTVVGTGNAPFDFLTANETYRDVFFDAPLEEMADLSSQWPNPNRAQDPSRGPQSHPDYPPRPPPNAHQPQSRPYSPSSIPIVPRTDRGQGKSGTSAVSSPNIYDPTNSYYASTSFTKSIGHVWGSRLTQEQLQQIRGQIRGAHARGLKVRYWNLPMWPIGLRNHVWHILIREGVDMLNVDDLRHATRRDWRRGKGWGY